MTEPCRLCGGLADGVFSHRVLGKYDVRYFKCQQCGSLQTETPYWLTEAYAYPGVHIDVGQALRIVRLWLYMSKLLLTVDFPRDELCVDYGGSAGLLTRLMRDSGFNFFSLDAFEFPKYADYFRLFDLNGQKAVLVTAFEVFEHFPNPAEELGRLLKAGPDVIFFTTQFHEAQGADWPYLVPYCGQHVFFFSTRGLAKFADLFGYNLHVTSVFSILSKRDGRFAGAPLDMPQFSNEELGALVSSIWHGTASTQKDGAYAIDRFISELPKVTDAAEYT